MINMGNSRGWTGLHMAMRYNSIEVVELLLAREEIDIAVTSRMSNMTPLHMGCIYNRIHCVRLYLAHTQCTMDIVTMVNRGRRTAEMVATENGYQECARIVREYLTTVSTPVPSARTTPTLSQLAEALEGGEADKATLEESIQLRHTEQRRKINTIEKNLENAIEEKEQQNNKTRDDYSGGSRVQRKSNQDSD